MTESEKNITARIHEFDLLALLRLLEKIGYPFESIRFRSHSSICSQAGLIKSISFRDSPRREVVVSMNVGLLSAQSPLPSYFRKRLDVDQRSARNFEMFCSFFDHLLLLNYICNLYPELNTKLYPSWQENLQRYLHIIDLKSSSALHWLFQLVFPEVHVSVKQTVMASRLKTVPLLLGSTQIGCEATFGSHTHVPVSGRTVTLVTDNELNNTGVPWPKEARQRLNELLFPVLRPTGVHLHVELMLQDQKRWVKLMPQTFLGYDRLRNGTSSFRKVTIFNGSVAEFGAQPDTKTSSFNSVRMTNEM